jgi:hypothetical protein
MKIVSLGLVLVLGGVLAACGSSDTSGTKDGGTGGSGTGGTGGTDAGTGGIGIGGTGGSSGSAGAQNCGSYGDSTGCQDCLKTSCCQQGGTCLANGDCDALVTCARQCPNPADTQSTCFQACATQSSAGISAYNGLAICLSNNCASSCQYP